MYECYVFLTHSNTFEKSAELKNELEAVRDFREWADLFSSEVFVKLVAYADDSGTHDETGTLKGSEVVIVGGMIAPRDEWVKFCAEWQRILNKYAAPYFHFREWYAASAVARNKRKPSSDFKKNPFREWDQAKLNSFILELAKVAVSGNKLSIGGYVPTTLFHKDKLAGVIAADRRAYNLCIDHFFDSVVSTIERQRAPWKRQPIAFFFDHCDNPKWRRAVGDKFYFHKTKNAQFKELSFVDKRDHLPLQAADMYAYRMRQRMEKVVNDYSGASSWPELDGILFKDDQKFFEHWFNKLSQKEQNALIRKYYTIV